MRRRGLACLIFIALQFLIIFRVLRERYTNGETPFGSVSRFHTFVARRSGLPLGLALGRAKARPSARPRSGPPRLAPKVVRKRKAFQLKLKRVKPLQEPKCRVRAGALLHKEGVAKGLYDAAKEGFSTFFAEAAAAVRLAYSLRFPNERFSDSTF